MKKNIGTFGFQRCTLRNIKQLAVKFVDLHEITYIIGAIDRSHYLITAPSIDLTLYYYYRKWLYLVLLQDIVDSQCTFWNYDFSGAKNIYDWLLL